MSTTVTKNSLPFPFRLGDSVEFKDMEGHTFLISAVRFNNLCTSFVYDLVSDDMTDVPHEELSLVDACCANNLSELHRRLAPTVHEPLLTLEELQTIVIDDTKCTVSFVSRDGVKHNQHNKLGIWLSYNFLLESESNDPQRYLILLRYNRGYSGVGLENPELNTILEVPLMSAVAECRPGSLPDMAELHDSLKLKPFLEASGLNILNLDRFFRHEHEDDFIFD